MAIPTGLSLHITQGTVGTVAAALGSVACDWFRVEAAAGISGTLYIGNSDVAATKYMVSLKASGSTNTNYGYDFKSPGAYDNARGVGGKTFDLAKIYIIGSAAGQVYNITYFARLNDG